jgi:hypothetical protein
MEYSSSSSSLFSICLLGFLFFFPSVLPPGPRDFVNGIRAHLGLGMAGGYDTSSDFSMSDISD